MSPGLHSGCQPLRTWLGLHETLSTSGQVHSLLVFLVEKHYIRNRTGTPTFFAVWMNELKVKGLSRSFRHLISLPGRWGEDPGVQTGSSQFLLRQSVSTFVVTHISRPQAWEITDSEFVCSLVLSQLTPVLRIYLGTTVINVS